MSAADEEAFRAAAEALLMSAEALGLDDDRMAKAGKLRGSLPTPAELYVLAAARAFVRAGRAAAESDVFLRRVGIAVPRRG